MIRTTRMAACVAAVAALAAIGQTGPASASPVAHPAFSAQSVRGGLSAAQSAELQHQVDATLAETGGRQVSANRIELAGDASVLIPVPGEKYARDLATGAGPAANARAAALAECKYGNFCGWKGAEYTGKIWQRGTCGAKFEIPDGWNSGGSWWNHQTGSHRAKMYGKTGKVVFTTPPANDPNGSFDPHGNWGPVWRVQPC
ncbi:peptidase inhibitor family I36 protein [Streptomyces sp. NPDC006632]|uniref:peptidase inhibitor family I36 protein n=1 Tax=unclassified Streptomyces TaxID=2593676 RepID=UPI002E20D5F0